MKTLVLTTVLLLGLSQAWAQAPTSDVINSDINWLLRFDQYWSNADGDDFFSGADDFCMRTKLYQSATNSWDEDDNCFTWAADAPSYADATRWYWRTYDDIDAFVKIYLLAYESDNSEWCSWYDDDDFPFQGESEISYIANAGLPCRWGTYHGPNNASEWLFPNAEFWDLKVKSAWRYAAGDFWGNPLNFGTIGMGETKVDHGTNYPDPGQNVSGGPAIGWTNTEGQSSPDVFYKFTIAQRSKVIINTDYGITDYDSYITLFNSNHEFIAEDDDSGTTGDGKKAVLTINLDPGTYIFRLEGYSDYTGQYALHVDVLPGNDNTCDAYEIPANGVVQTGFSNAGTGVQTDENDLAPAGTDCANSWCESVNEITNSVWFKFVAPSTGAVEVSTCDMADFDSQIAVYSTNSCSDLSSYTLLAANDDGQDCDDYSSKMTVSGLTPGSTYYIIVDGYDGDTGSFDIKVTPVTVTAAHEVQLDAKSLDVFPNPSNGQFNVRLDGEEYMEAYKLFDLTGKEVKNETLSNPGSLFSVQTQGLVPGIYLLKVNAGDRVLTKKVIIE